MTPKEIKETPSVKNGIYQKLGAIQSNLKAPKSQENNFGHYKYRSCEDILEAVKPFVSEVKLTLLLNDELINIGDRYYIKATATITDGEFSVSVSGIAREEENKKGMDGSQITGASSSYARKYALNALFLIDDTKDSDSTNKHEASTAPAKPTEKSEENCKKCLNGNTIIRTAGPTSKRPGAKYAYCNDCKGFSHYIEAKPVVTIDPDSDINLDDIPFD